MLFRSIFSDQKTEQILFLNENGLQSISPNDGKLLWKFKSKGNPILQPTLLPDNELLISMSAFNGLQRIRATNENNEWIISERWTSPKFKPNHNDFVVHKGFIYGMDMTGLQCLDIENGERRWKGGRYGGQLLLLADQDLLLILTEKGELALVEAKPEKYKELGRINAIKGKTWNHPVLTGNIVLVRNASEMAAFRLP